MKVNHIEVAMFYVANTPFNTIRENKIPAKNSEFYISVNLFQNNMRYILKLYANNQCTEELVGTHSLLFTFLNRFLKSFILIFRENATLKLKKRHSRLN